MKEGTQDGLPSRHFLDAVVLCRRGVNHNSRILCGVVNKRPVEALNCLGDLFKNKVPAIRVVPQTGLSEGTYREISMPTVAIKCWYRISKTWYTARTIIYKQKETKINAACCLLRLYNLTSYLLTRPTLLVIASRVGLDLLQQTMKCFGFFCTSLL